MQRNEWKFDYTARNLAAAARERLEFHQERLAFWKQKRDEVLAQIRSEGVEVDEKILLGYRNPKSRDWEQVLAANPESRLALDVEDWLFFFSKG